MKKVLVKYSEIALKGKNRYIFENKLIENIRKSSQRQSAELIKIIRQRFRILIIFSDATSDENIINSLNKVFGIKNFSIVIDIEKDMGSILNKAEEILNEFKEKGITNVSFKTNRNDKSFSVKSPEVNSQMGEIATKLNLKVDYKNAQDIIYLEISKDGSFIYSKKHEGLGGLPVGSVGRVLVLLSGGIDSPVAAYQIMKRGCSVDFIHFHTFEDNSQVLDTKIKEVVNKLNDYNFESRLYLMPYRFYKTLSCSKVSSKYSGYRLVLFKHFIFKMADEIAKELQYDAILTGDSLAQVASQTIENMNTTQKDISSLILRPLITYDKEEIINLAIKIGTYDLSIEQYPDCCSLVSKDALTKTKSYILEKVTTDVGFNDMLKKALRTVENYDI